MFDSFFAVFDRSIVDEIDIDIVILFDLRKIFVELPVILFAHEVTVILKDDMLVLGKDHVRAQQGEQADEEKFHCFLHIITPPYTAHTAGCSWLR